PRQATNPPARQTGQDPRPDRIRHVGSNKTRFSGTRCTSGEALEAYSRPSSNYSSPYCSLQLIVASLICGRMIESQVAACREPPRYKPPLNVVKDHPHRASTKEQGSCIS